MSCFSMLIFYRVRVVLSQLGQVSSKFAAAKNDQVSSKFVQIHIKVAAENCFFDDFFGFKLFASAIDK